MQVSWSKPILCLLFIVPLYCYIHPYDERTTAPPQLTFECYKGKCDANSEYCAHDTEQCHACSELCQEGGPGTRREGHRPTSCELECPVYLELQHQEQLQQAREECLEKAAASTNSVTATIARTEFPWYLVVIVILVLIIVALFVAGVYKLHPFPNPRNGRYQGAVQSFCHAGSNTDFCSGPGVANDNGERNVLLADAVGVVSYVDLERASQTSETDTFLHRHNFDFSFFSNSMQPTGSTQVSSVSCETIPGSTQSGGRIQQATS